jgi:hypothetical protein
MRQNSWASNFLGSGGAAEGFPEFRGKTNSLSEKVQSGGYSNRRALDLRKPMAVHILPSEKQNYLYSTKKN